MRFVDKSLIGRKNLFRFEIWVHKDIDKQGDLLTVLKSKLNEILETTCIDTIIKL